MDPLPCNGPAPLGREKTRRGNGVMTMSSITMGTRTIAMERGMKLGAGGARAASSQQGKSPSEILLPLRRRRICESSNSKETRAHRVRACVDGARTQLPRLLPRRLRLARPRLTRRVLDDLDGLFLRPVEVAHVLGRLDGEDDGRGEATRQERLPVELRKPRMVLDEGRAAGQTAVALAALWNKGSMCITNSSSRK